VAALGDDGSNARALALPFSVLSDVHPTATHCVDDAHDSLSTRPLKNGAGPSVRPVDDGSNVTASDRRTGLPPVAVQLVLDEHATDRNWNVSAAAAAAGRAAQTPAARTNRHTSAESTHVLPSRA
jgi:hypothetical protein